MPACCSFYLSSIPFLRLFRLSFCSHFLYNFWCFFREKSCGVHRPTLFIPRVSASIHFSESNKNVQILRASGILSTKINPISFCGLSFSYKWGSLVRFRQTVNVSCSGFTLSNQLRFPRNIWISISHRLSESVPLLFTPLPLKISVPCKLADFIRASASYACDARCAKRAEFINVHPSSMRHKVEHGCRNRWHMYSNHHDRSEWVWSLESFQKCSDYHWFVGSAEKVDRKMSK